MHVNELMTPSPAVCAPDDPTTVAAVKMRENDCGILPVLEAGKLVGVVTDRDVCFAHAVGQEGSDATRVRGAMSREVFSCAPQDEIDSALRTMAERHVRRLPVVATDGSLQGLLSIDDVVAHARSRDQEVDAPTYGQVIDTLRRISERPLVYSPD